MYKFQTMLNVYAVDWSGQYPDNVEILFKEANEKQYWKELQNPFMTDNKAYDNLPNIKKVLNPKLKIFIAGTVYY
ncbi:hypothetical protein EON71_01230, partial [bacterium]